MKNVIITGSTGFIGKYLTKEFLNNDYDVYAVVRSKDKIKDLMSDQKLHLVEESLETLKAESFPDIEYESFIHFAWSGVNRNDINSKDIHKKNFDLSVKCLTIAEKLGCRKFIDSGSRAEYGWQKKIHSETMKCEPYTAYGTEKLNFYYYAHNYCNNLNMIFYHIRLFSVIGVGDHPWSLISSGCRNFKNNEPMSFGPCTQLWNFLDVEDAVSAIRMLSELSGNCEFKEDLFNIAGYDTRILRSFVEEIYNITNSHSVMSFAEEKDDQRIDFMNPDIKRITSATGWRPKKTFGQSIRKILSEEIV